jgi:hypothetical protein
MTMIDTQPLLQVSGVTFAVSDVLTVEPLEKHHWNAPTYLYRFFIKLRSHVAEVEWRGAKFIENDRFPEREKDAFAKANNARNAVIQAAWPDGHVTVVE